MEASKQQIANIFNGHRILQVPFYQRHYVWQEEQWKRFLDDMELISKLKQDYFLGSVILKQQQTDMGETNDYRTIIDGQQRFTTLAIFAKSLCLKNNDMETFQHNFSIRGENRRKRTTALIHGFNDRKDFEKIFYLQEDKKIEIEDSNILKCYNYFQENINIAKLNIDTLLAHIVFIAIDLQEKDDEQVIFDTINSLGMRLTTAELLKNYFFNEKSIDEYESLWKPVFEKDDELIKYWESQITTGRFKRSNIDTFLYAFLNIKIQDNNIGVSTEHKTIYRRAEGLFANYKDFISSYNIDKNEIRREIIDYAKIYHENFNPQIDYNDIGGKPCIERINFIIKVLDSSTLVPYVLYILKNVDNIEERNLIFDYLESYVIRRILCKSNNNSFSDLFTENLIGNRILTFESLRDYIENRGKNTALAIPTDSEIFNSINTVEHPNKRALAILYLMESRSREKNPHATKLYPFTGYSLEHLMPKKHEKNWPLNNKYSKDEREHLIETLGNMAMIPQRLNSSISNASWKIKLKGNTKYKGLKELASDIELLNDVIIEKSWNKDAIKTRCEKLAKQVIDIWTAYQSDTVNTESTHRKYALNDSEFMSMSQFVLTLIRAFIDKHPDYTYKQIKDRFSDELCARGYKFKGLLCTKEDYENWDNKNKEKRYQPEKVDRKLFSADHVEFYVNTQWTRDAMPKIIKLAEEEGLHIKIKTI